MSASTDRVPGRRPRTLVRRELVQSPLVIRRLAFALTLGLPLFALLSGLLPWQQSAMGQGEVVAYAPEARTQTVEAPLSGRILEWAVTEGDAVTQGQLLVRLGDNDPERLQRLQQERQALLDERTAAQSQLRSKEIARLSKEASREQIDAEYDAKVAELRRKLVADQAAQTTAQLNLDRIGALTQEGVNSTRDLELATLEVAKVSAAVEARVLEIHATERAQAKSVASADAEVAVAQAEIDEVSAKIAALDGKLTQLDGKIARQQTQDILAPRDGVVLRLEGAPVGGQVKAGDPLLDLVPDASEQAVALYVQGADLPWIQEGDAVRLIFEGIPAVNWVGPPGDGVGTYPGRIALVDATDVGGEFRVLVVPEGDAEWPVVRQGVRAKGFVLLGQVSLAWEVWRRLNGFPPVQDSPKSTGDLPATNKKPRKPGLK